MLNDSVCYLLAAKSELPMLATCTLANQMTGLVLRFKFYKYLTGKTFS